MFQHILLPLDGSAPSRRVLRKALAFAREAGARMTAYYALPLDSGGVFGEGYRFPRAATAKAELREARARFIAEGERAARAAGVPFQSLVNRAFSPERGIVDAARTKKCDLILMGTHGRRGLARLALGSVASRVLAASPVPVLVYR